MMETKLINDTATAVPSMQTNKQHPKSNLKLINMDDIEVEEVRWLWYPFIPFGKITVIQGDPGNGKTTLILAITAAVTKGEPLPEGKTATEPMTVIFQTAEDGLGDTVKPRLLNTGADCSRVIVIDESEKELYLSDTRIEETLTKTGAKLLILDPLQAYIGADIDMHRANEIRPVLKRISLIAEKTGCAIVVVGHLNKGTNKSQYRGLGSIDIQAAARSVLTVGRLRGKPYLRAFAQGKNNLAPEGKSIAFELNPDSGFRWIGVYPITIDELLGGGASHETVSERAQALLVTELTGKSLPANKMFELAEELEISQKTLKRVKSSVGVHSYKKHNQWFWTIDKAAEQGGHATDVESTDLPDPCAENGGISGYFTDPDDAEKQEGQKTYIEKMTPLPSCNETGGIAGSIAGPAEFKKEGGQIIYAEKMAPLPPCTESGGITGKTEGPTGPEKQGGQKTYIEEMAPLPPCGENNDANGADDADRGGEGLSND